MNEVNNVLNPKYCEKRRSNKKTSCLKNINKLLDKGRTEKYASARFKEKLLSTSALTLILQANCLSKDSLHTISRYEKLRNFCLKDGPQISKSVSNPIDVIFGKDKRFFNGVQDSDIEKAEKLEYIWKNSIHILQENKCKDLLEFIMEAHTKKDLQAYSFPEMQLENLKKGIRELKKHYKKYY